MTTDVDITGSMGASITFSARVSGNVSLSEPIKRAADLTVDDDMNKRRAVETCLIPVCTYIVVCCLICPSPDIMRFWAGGSSSQLLISALLLVISSLASIHKL